MNDKRFIPKIRVYLTCTRIQVACVICIELSLGFVDT